MRQNQLTSGMPVAKRAEAKAERERRLYQANILPIDPSSLKFTSTVVDLNEDGVLDAIVLMTGDACGTGGCALEVYRGTTDGFEFVSGSTVSREPIHLLPDKDFGWHSFTVLSTGGGGAVCKGSIMRFDGRKYPSNPSVQPCATPDQLEDATQLHMTQ